MRGESVINFVLRKSSSVFFLAASILIFILFPKINYSQFNSPVFENISMEDGLPENSVTCILQDYLGYLWLGTQNGLVRYDGYSMTVFQSEEGDSGTISGRRITTIFEDKNKVIWIGTLNGLNKFDRVSETFNSYKYISDDKSSINSNEIYSLYEDTAGRFWVGTAEGLNLVDRENEIFTRYYFRLGDQKSYKTSLSYFENLCVNAIIQNPLSEDLLIGTAADGLWMFNIKEETLSKYKSNNDNNPDKKIGWIQSFYKSSNGIIWMTSYHTLCSLDPQKKEFNTYIEFPIKKEERYAKRDNNCGTVIEDQNGLIWCGFFAGENGVFCLNPKTGIYQQYKISPEKLKHSYFNAVFKLYEDRSGIIWIGTWMAGLNKFDKNKNEFQLLKSETNYSSNSLSHSDVYSVIYDHKGFIWFCTRNALDRYDIKTRKYKFYLKNENCITQSPYTAIKDASGDLWLGTSTCGIIRFNTADGSYRFYYSNPNESTNLLNKKIVRLFQDHLGFLWISTDGFGVYKLDISNYKLTQYKYDPNDSLSLRNDQVRDLYEDRSGTIWVGTNAGGLNKYNRKTEEFSYNGFNAVSVIYEDKNGNFWVADYLTGLHLFDREKRTIIENYNQKNGFISNAIFGILEDDHNNLWLGTEKGLSKFNTITKTFKHYHEADGLPNDWFEVASTYGKGPDGEMYFNTRKGLIVFHPDSIKNDTIPPQIVLSGVSLFNRPGEKLNLKGFISELKEITLPYDQNDLRFDYVGLQYSEPGKNTYKYILENFDKTWINAGNQRNATYTNLEPGEYNFKVMAANRDGIWSEQAAVLRIIITPPWWKTVYAYLLYIILGICTIYFLWKFQLKRIRTKHEYEMSKFEAQKLHEVEELKSRFFTNISHEFRTPLTLIIGPVKQIIEKMSNSKIKDDLIVVDRNANKLLGLVNQLLDISKIESGHMKLQTSAQNVIVLLKALVLSFVSYAERKNITLKFSSPEDEIIAYIDNEKIEKIINNIISNAFKFTPDGGLIEVKVVKNDRYINVNIRDTGIGIPKEKISKIFNRFYQVSGSRTRMQEGTGIGLSITKELIELHKGKISIESEEGKGTIITISIPLGKEHLKPEEIIEVAEEKNKEILKNEILLAPEEYVTKINDYKIENELYENESLPLLLIVEDNTDVRNYIINNLKDNYKILEAVNGEEGWYKSMEHIPDLIISDVMMPMMDGFELCKKIKTDERTSHIPVILLTAKAANQDKIQGFETGADEYIMKPFMPEILKARIKNLLEQRSRIHEHFRNQDIIDLEKIKIASFDKKFLQKVFNIITENISDSSFNVQLLAERSIVSYQVLHKKIVSLTGEPPVELIRRIRLKRASELIKSKFGNISEIALEVGFNNPAYFSECFKKQFGLSPSQYTRKLNN